MAKARLTYECSNCQATYPKWQGQCDGCGEWSTLQEKSEPTATPKGLGAARGAKIDLVPLKGESERPPRMISGIAEFDRVTGGGLVPGSALLVGGDPGIGKSTLLLQVTAAMAAKYGCAYISGEEAIDQLRLRAERLKLADAPVGLAAATNVRDIATTLEQAPPGVVVIDSIQTMFVDTVDSAPGTVSQVRTSAQEIIRRAKQGGFAVLIVGHVTKDGQIAGPRVLEHMVDTVLYFEGERGHHFRILRSVKNRFGATDEIGVFEMTDGGLKEVPNPSALFLADHDRGVAGNCVFAGLEGTRPMLVEIQSLVAQSDLGTPRRAVIGWDSGRLAMVMAVMETRGGVRLAGNDVYLNVAGGLKISEPAADLAVAAALASSISGVAVPPETVVFGEIGLSGEIRPVSQIEARLKEARKLGFTNAVIPKRRKAKDGKSTTNGMKVREIGHIAELLSLFEGATRSVEQLKHG